MIFSILLVILGFVALVYGANWLVDGASFLAKKHNVSDLVIGLTIVAFGTSAPELVVNIIASTKGYSDIVLGNIIGSNNFNLFIILGISALILPIKVQGPTAWKEIPFSLLVSLFLLFLLNDFQFSGSSSLSRIDGFIMLTGFGLFLYYVFKQLKKDSDIHSHPEIKLSSLKIWGLLILGLSGLIIGGQLVVLNSVEIAHSLHISEKIIGLTIVAAGTSLPELVTSIVAATKKNGDIAIGNVVGSNIFNILLILSISSFIRPIDYNPRFDLDLYVLIGGTMLLLIWMMTGQKRKIDRWEAGILVAIYVFYTLYLILNEV